MHHKRREQHPPRAALIFKVSAVAMAMFVAAGCATPKPLTPQEQLAVWLSESPRTIAVSVDPKLPEATLVTRDHHAGERVGQGVAGGVKGGAYVAISVVGAACQGGALGCMAGIFLAPIGFAFGAVVGAVGGAASVQSTDQSHPLTAAQGAPEMLAVNQAIDLPAMLAAAVSERPVRPHALRAAQYGKETRTTGEGTLRLQFDAFSFFGDVGDDAEVALMLKVGAQMQTSTFTAGWGGYSYEGSRRRVSIWLADDARRLKEEANIAVRSLAADIRQDLDSPRSLKKRPPYHYYQAPSASQPTPSASQPTPSASQPSATSSWLRLMARIGNGDAFPPGTLSVATHTVRKIDKDYSAGWLVVNFDAPNETGASSYVADTMLSCDTGILSISWWTTFALRNGGGAVVDSHSPSPPLVITKPSAALASGGRAICILSGRSTDH